MVGESTIINGDFKMCQLNKNRAVWNLPDSCVQPHYSKSNVANNQQYFILKENQYTVSGTLWHCQMKYITTVVTKNLFGFGAIEKTVSEQWVPLNREQCIEMKQKKFCGLEQNKMVCNQDSCIYLYIFRSFANIYTKLEKEFFIFNDYNRNEAVIYTDQGRIFVPDCVIINKFKLLEKTEKCYKDFPITFKRNNKTIKAFLTQVKIIKLNSDEVSCQSLYRTCHL
jgi:hypothetical protein